MTATQVAGRFDQENPGLRQYLFAHSDEDFLGSLYRQLTRKGDLSERQIAAALRSQEREAEFTARRETEREALRDVDPIVEGRREIEGEVLSTKWKESMYGTTLKMLVREDDGNKVWGTVPEALQQLTFETWSEVDQTYVPGIELKGSRVALTAEVTRSEDDEHFGFYKRPKNPRLIEAGVRPEPEPVVEPQPRREYDEDVAAHERMTGQNEDEPEFTIASLAAQYAKTQEEGS